MRNRFGPASLQPAAETARHSISNTARVMHVILKRNGSRNRGGLRAIAARKRQENAIEVRVVRKRLHGAVTKADVATGGMIAAHADVVVVAAAVIADRLHCIGDISAC